MDMAHVDSAEKEASEVLHSLLSVERIEKHIQVDEQQVVDVTSTSTGLHQLDAAITHQEQWQSPIYTNVNQPMGVEQHQVLWEGHTVQVDEKGNICQTLPSQEVYASDFKAECDNNKTIVIEEIGQEKPKRKRVTKPKEPAYSPDPTVLEDNAQQVRERFDKGCECREENCFKGLSPENVYRHRLNIAELTKAEHDMYLMGVTMAVLTNPEETVRRKERRRLRAQYVFQGRRVCLDAFLYLENCTHYQLKRIRKHVMTHGVAPRVHGNHGKKPHNTFPLDIYRQATEFLRRFIERKTPQINSPHLHAALVKNKPKAVHKNMPLYLPAEITRKTIHNAYKDYCDMCEPTLKVMGYSTFRHFMKDQFPNLKFCKIDTPNGKAALTGFVEAEIPQHIQLHGSLMSVDDSTNETRSIITSNGEVQQVTTIPVVLAHDRNGTLQQPEQTTYIVTPVTQMSTVGGESQAFTQYQLTPAPNYALHQNTITMSNTQAGTYAFTTL